MKRLAEQKYWDSIYKNNQNGYFAGSFWLRAKYVMRNYADYLIWEKIFPAYMPHSGNEKAIEIGCAPGKNLVLLNKNLGYEPYGVEYSPDGAEVTKRRLDKENLPSQNIILSDFFDQKFQTEYKDFFDVVYSKGFIEHFDNPKEVVRAHENILKNGGTLVIQIPNLSGLNFYLSKFFNIESHNLHNTSIMNMKSFKSLFGENIEPLFIGYVGLFNIGLFNTKSSLKEKIRLAIYYILQQPLNLLFRLISHVYRIESKYTSPYIILIGRKKEK